MCKKHGLGGFEELMAAAGEHLQDPEVIAAMADFDSKVRDLYSASESIDS